jgi:hypothetical protein
MRLRRELADSMLTITFVDAKYSNVSLEVTLTGTMGRNMWRGPLVEEVTIGVDDVRLLDGERGSELYSIT